MFPREQAQKLKAQPEWQHFEAYIRECIAVLDSCSSIPDGDDHDKAARGRKEAVAILYKVLEPFDYKPAIDVDKRNESLRKLSMM